MHNTLLHHIAQQALVVRIAQKKYYNPKTKTQSALVESKIAEKLLDGLLEQFAKEQEQAERNILQLQLFGNSK
jgi:hypothetical protein